MNPACFPCVPVWNTKSTAFIADKPIKRNRSFRAQIEVQLGRFLQRACGQHACLMMFYIRRTVYTLMVSAVLPVAPFNRLVVQIGKFSKYTALNEVLLHEADEALYGSFGKRVPRLAKPGVESYVSHKELHGTIWFTYIITRKSRYLDENV